MAFLFKKKNADKIPSQARGEAPNGVVTSQISLQGANARPSKDEKASNPQSTPSSSVNTSMNSLGGGTTPSPEQNGRARAPSTDQGMSDLPLRNMTAPAVQPSSSSPNASLYPWSQRRLTYTSSHPSPFPRYGAAVNSVASKEGDIYLMGGLINSSTVKGDLWMVEAGGGNMACYPLATTAEGPGPRVGHASLLVGNAFIVYGGDTKLEDTDVLDETLYLLNTSTRQWSRAVPAGPRPSGRYGHSLNILGSKIYVFGGQVEGYFMNDLVAFDLNQLQVPSNRWEMLIRNSDEGGPPPGQVPPARTNHSMVTFNEKLYLFGGTNGFQWFNDVWCYDPLTNVWSELDCIGYIPAPREGHAAALVDDVMYIFGGRTEEGADLGDLAAFRITSRRWYTFQNMGPSPSPRSGHSMTSHGKQVIVLAGEPSSAAREAQDLAIVYVLDTTKIRYPNDQQIQQTPAGERVAGRRPSGGEKTGMGANRGLTSRDGSVGPEAKRLNGMQTRESVMGAPNLYTRPNGQPGVNGNDINGVAPGSAQPQGPGTVSKLPRASTIQAQSGPPPLQQAPRPNAPPPSTANNPARSKPAARPERGFGPSIDTGVRSQSPSQIQSKPTSPISRDSPSAKESPITNGRRTPTQPPGKSSLKQDSVDLPAGEAPGRDAPSRSGSKTRSGRQQGSLDSINETTLRTVQGRPSSPPPPSRQGSSAMGRKGSGRNSQTVAILKELEAAKSRNAWYASELELAKKAGYQANPSPSPILDQRAAESFGEADRPLIEALIAMRNELANVQGSIDQQAITAAKKIAEVERQRDAAVSEAFYAKAKLAAHGGSQNSTPQLDSDSREVGVMTASRSTDIARKLAASLATQKELQQHVDILTAEIEAEKRGRKLAEETAAAAETRLSDLETFKQQNGSEVERLKAELHEVHKESRENAAARTEAISSMQILHVGKGELETRHKELLESTQGHNEMLDSLREAMAASAEMKSVLERKLDEERTQRESVEERLRKLRSEHEERTAELDTATRKLRDAEEIAEKHANEAKTHRQAVAAGLDRITSRDIGSDNARSLEGISALQAQIEAANALARKYQAAADLASEKVRGAEERIAGLEAYQEQASREGMSVRKQLQAAMREAQSLQAANAEIKSRLANQQLESDAINVQHNTLKELLGERGISPVEGARGLLSSPQNQAETLDQTRLRDLEQQLASVQQAHQETKQTFETREQEAESSYREKLAQLEHDYQSAVHYVKGTEKMLKRMKDELSKYKGENNRMRAELEDVEGKLKTSRSVPSEWEGERGSLRQQIESLQTELQNSHGQLERQMQEVRRELQASQQERDHFKRSHEDAERELSQTMQQARADLTQMQQENALLERRAMDAEQKVSLLLDQVESSVDNYRRQSRTVGEMNGSSIHHGHTRSLSGHDSISGESMYSGTSSGTITLDNRNSIALDSLASELETLRTHWETTNKNYRLSNNFEFDRPSRIGDDDDSGKLDSGPPLELSNSLADWRKRLDAEEHDARSRIGSKASMDGGGLASKVPDGRRPMTPEEPHMI